MGKKSATPARHSSPPPRRSCSPYICFLRTFRIVNNMDGRPQREVCAAAGQAWAEMSEEEKAPFVQQSQETKEAWAAHHKSQRDTRTKGIAMQGAAPKRPKGAYLCFLEKYRADWKAKHPGQKIHQRDLCAQAGKAWAELDPEERSRYEHMSTASKAVWAEYMERQRGAKEQQQQSAYNLVLALRDSGDFEASAASDLEGEEGGGPLATPLEARNSLSSGLGSCDTHQSAAAPSAAGDSHSLGLAPAGGALALSLGPSTPTKTPAAVRHFLPRLNLSSSAAVLPPCYGQAAEQVLTELQGLALRPALHRYQHQQLLYQATAEGGTSNPQQQQGMGGPLVLRGFVVSNGSGSPWLLPAAGVGTASALSHPDATVGAAVGAAAAPVGRTAAGVAAWEAGCCEFDLDELARTLELDVMANPADPGWDLLG
ncbi:hypothetical protein N2152v2_010808 [Parachlorella kessleri]